MSPTTPSGAALRYERVGFPGELLAGRVGVVLEWTGRFQSIDARYPATGRELRDETGTVGKRGEIDMIHRDFGTIIRLESRAKELPSLEIGFRAVKEWALVWGVACPRVYARTTMPRKSRPPASLGQSSNFVRAFPSVAGCNI